MPQWIYNFGLAGWLLVEAYCAGGAWVLQVVLVLNAWFVLWRRVPEARAVTLAQAGGVLVAMGWPVVFRIAPVGWPALPALVLQGGALALWAASVVTLGTNYSAFPERRLLVTRGVYGWVRHPMYAASLLLDLGFWLAHPLPWFAVVWVLRVLLLEARTRWEEAVMAGDGGYANYQQRVRWRLIPGLF